MLQITSGHLVGKHRHNIRVDFNSETGCWKRSLLIWKLFSCSLNDTFPQMVHPVITTGLDCSHLNRYICITLQVLIILFKSMTNWASLCSQPRQQTRMDCIFHCSVEGDTSVPGLMENFAESHRNLKSSQFYTSFKTWARKKLHLCSIITGAAASSLWRKC